MKLGEALSERARLQKRISELRSRISMSAAAQEDTTPPENASTLISEAETVHEALAVLIGRINHTNASTKFKKGTLTDALAERDRLAGLIATYKQAADAAQGDTSAFRYMRSELKLTRHVDVKALHEKADKTSAKLRKLDNEIQVVNWATDLI